MEFCTNQVARMFRVTLRQLQWWDEQRVVTPRHAGHRRIYHSDDVFTVGLISELKRRGMSLRDSRNVLKAVKRSPAKRYLVVPVKSRSQPFWTDDLESAVVICTFAVYVIDTKKIKFVIGIWEHAPSAA